MTAPPNLLQLADEYAKAYFMGRGDDARKRLQAAIMGAETAAEIAELQAVADERKACTAIAKATCSPEATFFGNGFNSAALEIEKAILSRGSISSRSLINAPDPIETTNHHALKSKI